MPINNLLRMQEYRLQSNLSTEQIQPSGSEGRGTGGKNNLPRVTCLRGRVETEPCVLSCAATRKRTLIDPNGQVASEGRALRLILPLRGKWVSCLCCFDICLTL